MFLKETNSGDLVEILTLQDLFDPFREELVGRYQHGEEMQDPEKFAKSVLGFPSGESLPTCWTNPHYRDQEMQR